MLTIASIELIEAHHLTGLDRGTVGPQEATTLNTTSAIARPPSVTLDRMWHRGRFAPSLQAENAERSAEWRDALIKNNLPRLLETELGHDGGVEFWRWLAGENGRDVDGIQKRSGLKKEPFEHAISVGMKHDILFQLPSWNEGPAPILYWTDPGILNQLIGLSEPLLKDWTGRQTLEEQQDRQVARAMSYEGFSISTLLRAVTGKASGSYWRVEDDPKGEIDLILNWVQPPEKWAIEVTQSPSRRLGLAFPRGCEETDSQRAILIHTSELEEFKLSGTRKARLPIEALSLPQALSEVLQGP